TCPDLESRRGKCSTCDGAWRVCCKTHRRCSGSRQRQKFTTWIHRSGARCHGDQCCTEPKNRSGEGKCTYLGTGVWIARGSSSRNSGGIRSGLEQRPSQLVSCHSATRPTNSGSIRCN